MTSLSVARTGLQDWLLTRALPLWWTVGADHQRGGFYDAIGQDGAPAPLARRIRVQARQTYVYAEAGRLGWTGPWRQAMSHGLDYLLTRYVRPDGLFRASVDADGAPVDESAILYDQAFTLFAMAVAFGAARDRDDLPERARSLLDRIEISFGHDGRGFRENSPEYPFHANPHMHMLEASLAWAEVDDAPVWPALADRIVELCLSRFIDARTGVLREYFDAEWRPVPGVDGRIVEPGHQFEWAWLLQRWGVARGRADACAAAARLFEIGSRFGVDRARGVAIFELLDDFSPHQSMARLWAQTEWIKASAILAEAAGDEAERRRLQGETATAVRGLMRYFGTAVPGLWWDKLSPSDTFLNEPAPASSFYHIVCAISELQARTGG